jgi:hypothetical protein
MKSYGIAITDLGKETIEAEGVKMFNLSREHEPLET